VFQIALEGPLSRGVPCGGVVPIGAGVGPGGAGQGRWKRRGAPLTGGGRAGDSADGDTPTFGVMQDSIVVVV
jgi:hypothetical protein